LAILGLTAIGVVVVVSIFGGLRSENPASQDPEQFASRPGDGETTETSTSTLPLRLDEFLPGFADRLTLIVTTDDGVRSLVWDPASGTSRQYELDLPPMTETIYATFDSGGRSMAVTMSTTGTGKSVWAGTPTDVGESPDITRASSFIWHATEVGAVAWMGFPGDDGGLRTGTISPLTGDLVNVRDVSDLLTPGGIVRWDDQGFILNDADDIRAINNDGSMAWQQPGLAQSASSSFVVALVLDESTAEATWVILDRKTGERSTGITQPFELSRSDAWVTTSPSTGLIATVVGMNGRSSLTIRSAEPSATRIMQIDGFVIPLGFTSQGEYFRFEEHGMNDLVLVDSGTGAIRSVPIPDEYTVIGIDLG